MGKKSFLVDVDRCTGCNLCTIACKDEHVGSDYSPWTRSQPATGHFWIGVHAMERGRAPRVRMTYLPLFCQHCENAACIRACPEQAIKRRDDGLVWIDPGACTGCDLCREACPYGVIYMNDELGIAQKCTGCAHRVDAGMLPRCVDICPHQAIELVDEKEGVPRDDGRGESGEVYHPEYRAEPRVRWRGLPMPWIAGTIVDATDDECLAGASITALDLFEGASVSVQSDEFGDFWIRNLEKSRKYRLEIAKEGYERVLSVVTTEGDRELGELVLKRKAPPPDEVAGPRW